MHRTTTRVAADVRSAFWGCLAVDLAKRSTEVNQAVAPGRIFAGLLSAFRGQHHRPMFPNHLVLEQREPRFSRIQIEVLSESSLSGVLEQHHRRLQAKTDRVCR
jgi:hypothetical protein